MVVNKEDLEVAGEGGKVEDEIRGLNAAVEIRRGTKGKPNGGDWLEWLTKVGGYKAPGAFGVPVGGPHLGYVGSVSLFIEGVVDVGKLERWLGSLLWGADGVVGGALLVAEDDEAGGVDHADGEYGAGPQQIFRVKGIVSAGGENAAEEDDADVVDEDKYVSPKKYILQGVNDVFECFPVEQEWGASAKRRSDVVFIGGKLDKETLEEGLRNCLLDL